MNAIAPYLLPSRFHRTRAAIVFILCLLPLLFITDMVWHYAVNVPFGDDFATGETLCKWVNGSLRWSDLTAQHNESRLLFPRLIFCLMATHRPWDVRLEMAGSIVLVTITSALIIVIVRRNIAHGQAATLVALLINILLFSPVQWLNFLWGIQFITFVPALALAVVMLSLGSVTRLWLSLATASIAAIVATYSNSNGLLVWIVPLPFFLLHPSRFRLSALACWIIVAIATLACYFQGYQSPGDPPVLLALKQPTQAIRFVVAFLGNGVRRNDSVDSAVDAGSFALLIWVSALVYATICLRSAIAWRNLLPWITLGLYSIASGVLAMLGRLILFGLPGATTERYPTFAIPLWLSLVPMWAVIFQHKRPRRRHGQALAVPFLSAVSLAIVVMTIRAGVSVRSDIRIFNSRRLAGRTTAQFAKAAPDDYAIARTLHPNAGQTKQDFADLDRLNLWPFKFFSSADISIFTGDDRGVPAGEFESMVSTGGRLQLAGWAFLPSPARLADAVLLTTADARGVERVFAVAFRDREDRPDIRRLKHLDFLGKSGWTRTLDVSQLAPGAEISAWAFDAVKSRAYRLKGSHS